VSLSELTVLSKNEAISVAFTFLVIAVFERISVEYTKRISLLSAIGGFHVTQVSLIITQVKNKIAYHLINGVKKLKYRRGAINKQCAKVYSAKGITENYSV